MDNADTFDQAEWDKYFPVEQNSGDLNIPDFNLADFTGGYSGPPMDPIGAFGTAAGAGSGVTIPSIQEMADVNFSPAYFTHIPHLDSAQNQQR